jgi:hypothetical protein
LNITVNVITVDKTSLSQLTAGPVALTDDNSSDTIFYLHAFYFIMPIVAVLYHRQLKLIYKKYEYGVFIVLKFICFFSYLIVLILAYVVQSSTLKFTNQIIFIVIGSLTVIYSYGIFNIKIFSNTR